MKNEINSIECSEFSFSTLSLSLSLFLSLIQFCIISWHKQTMSNIPSLKSKPIFHSETVPSKTSSNSNSTWINELFSTLFPIQVKFNYQQMMSKVTVHLIPKVLQIFSWIFVLKPKQKRLWKISNFRDLIFLLSFSHWKIRLCLISIFFPGVSFCTHSVTGINWITTNGWVSFVAVDDSGGVIGASGYY